jgi:hypothetical protein
MADRATYHCVFAEEVAAFIVELPRAKQRNILALARTLAAQPFRVSDYVLRDDSGREIENISLGGWIISYWVDHAVKEVRIVDISEL